MSKVKDYLKNNSGKLTVPAVLICMCILFEIINPRFLSPSNMVSVLRQISMMCIIACGCSLVMISGCVDLSVGAICSISTVIWALCLTTFKLPMIIASIITMICGSLIGYVNGFIITKTRMNPMIATLGTAMSLGGISYIICNGGKPIYGLPDSAKIVGQGSLGVIPIPIILMVVCLVVNWFLLKRTYLGRSFYAVGSNDEATRLSGINSGKVRRIAYVLSGLFTSLCGIILASRVNSGQPAAGNNFQMNSLTACVVGGVSLAGGEGGTFAVLLGSLIMGIIENGFTIIKISEYWQQIARGLILVFAVAIDAIQKNKAEKAKKSVKHSK